MSENKKKQSVKVGQILFSQGTYQVEVLDSKDQDAYWPFLQIDDHGGVIDSFCMCPKAEAGEGCLHLEAAKRALFGGKHEPLHVRFQDSLCNQLCLIAAKRFGYETSIMQEGKDGSFTLHSKTGKELFCLKPLNAKGKATIRELITERVEETEESSIKFSKLSPEEFKLWKEGRPSLELQYELSFWSDLAKWWMLLQEKKVPCEFSFSPIATLPNWVTITFPEVEAGFYIAEANWDVVIPALETVDAPLELYEIPGKKITEILYDKENRVFKMIHSQAEIAVKEVSASEMKMAIAIGNWEYVPEKVFFPSRVDPLLLSDKIAAQKIGTFLNKHEKLLQKYLRNTPIHRGRFKAQYRLEMDSERGLAIEAYLFEPGDLTEGDAAKFDSWVYLDHKGFYHLEPLLFENVRTIIPLSEVSDFVHRHRNWLSEYEEFQIHLASIEAHLTYHVTDRGVLRFEPHFEFLEGEKEAISVGEWIYIQGKGFYPKVMRRMEGFLKEGTSIPSDEISPFIRRHYDELESVEGFFTKVMPLKRAGLDITLTESGTVVVTPHRFFVEGFEPAKATFFGDFLYIHNEGFIEIPQKSRLPMEYLKEKTISAYDLHRFVAFELKMLEPCILSIDPRLKSPTFLTLRLNEIKRDPKTKVPTWILDLTYESDIGEVDVFAIWEAMNQNKRFLFSEAGLLFFPQLRFNWLKKLSKKRYLQRGKKVRLTTLEWIRLNVLEEIEEPVGDSLQARRSRKVLKEFNLFETKEPLDLTGLQSKLRPYQETGVQWLWFLYCNGLSGMLCDDMGLGKTHQAMALLSSAFNARQSNDCKFLVVCPTSVLYHWEALLKRFLPKLKVCVFHGIMRKVPEDYDLLLTSYGIVRTERQFLAASHFEVAVFDELQAAKNAKSQTHKVLKTLDVKMRVGLTGTPIENRLLELKALFDIVVPAYLPQEAQFRELFVNPIEKNQDPEKQALLSRFIRPFILRRRKQEVLLELPEKTEEIAYCELSDEQRTLYKQVVQEHKEGLIKQLQDSNEPVPYLHIFSMLTTLKQICNHPALYYKKFAEAPRHKSGKWELFVELLKEARDSGQKLVVFSQYLGMLDIIEAHLRKEKIKYATIRGSTRDRREQMAKFQEDPKCEVFVASLKAAGVGVDLTAGSVVIHYDRWWNPAKENQATDRVHRIGQSRGVQVFKMVVRGTIEERIHQLIEKKMGLAEQVIVCDDENQVKTFDRHELIELIRQIELPVDSEE